MTISNYADLDGSRSATGCRPQFLVRQKSGIGGMNPDEQRLAQYLEAKLSDSGSCGIGAGVHHLALSRMPSRPMTPCFFPSRKDRRYCGFRIHVKALTSLIATVGLAACSLLLVVCRSSLWPISGDPLGSIFLIALTLAHVLLLYGERTGMSRAFVPYLILNPMSIVLVVFKFVIPLVIPLVQLPSIGQLTRMIGRYSKYDQDLIWTSIAVAYFTVVYLSMAVLLFVISELVVYRTYKLMRREKRRLEARYSTEGSLRSVYFTEASSAVQIGANSGVLGINSSRRYGRAHTLTKF